MTPGTVLRTAAPGWPTRALQLVLRAQARAAGLPRPCWPPGPPPASWGCSPNRNLFWAPSGRGPWGEGQPAQAGGPPGLALALQRSHSEAAQVLKDCLFPVGGETEGGGKERACQGSHVHEWRGPRLPGSRCLHPLLCPHAMLFQKASSRWGAGLRATCCGECLVPEINVLCQPLCSDSTIALSRCIPGAPSASLCFWRGTLRPVGGLRSPGPRWCLPSPPEPQPPCPHLLGREWFKCRPRRGRVLPAPALSLSPLKLALFSLTSKSHSAPGAALRPLPGQPGGSLGIPSPAERPAS